MWCETISASFILSPPLLFILLILPLRRTSQSLDSLRKLINILLQKTIFYFRHAFDTPVPVASSLCILVQFSILLPNITSFKKSIY